MKDLVMKTNLLSMDDRELMDVGSFINEEITRRNNNKKKNAWDKVVTAINDYVNEFGFICVRDGTTIAIDDKYDFSTPGEIEYKGW